MARRAGKDELSASLGREISLTSLTQRRGLDTQPIPVKPLMMLERTSLALWSRDA